MPTRKTTEKAKQDEREGKSPSTQAGEFVHEEIEHVREGKHGARSSKQAIAIGLSKARRAGVEVPAPKKGRASSETRAKARDDSEAGGRRKKAVSRKRSRATRSALKREGRSAGSSTALSRQAKRAARARPATERRAAARKAAATRKRK